MDPQQPHDSNAVDPATIAKKLGFDGLTSEEQEAVLAQAGAVIFQGVLVRALEFMTNNDAKDLAMLVDSGADPETTIAFLRDMVPEFDDILADEVANFQASMLQKMEPLNEGQA